MTLKIVSQAKPNTFAFENSALIKATGFREYDARWWFGHPGSEGEPELNLMGAQALGIGLGTLIRRMGVGPEIIAGHDFRSGGDRCSRQSTRCCAAIQRSEHTTRHSERN